MSDSPQTSSEAPENDGTLEQEGLQILSGLKDVALDPKAVDRLWDLAAQPLVLSDAQRAVIVETLRKKRGEYKAKKATRAAKKSPPKDAVKLEDFGIDASDLGL